MTRSIFAILTLAALSFSGWNSLFGFGFVGKQEEASSAGESTASAGVLDDELTRLLADAKANFQPFQPERLERAKAGVQAAADELESRLSQGTTEHVAAWKRYLQWEALENELAKENPEVNVLRGIQERLRRNHRGLELDGFTRLRAALDLYTKLAIVADIEDLEAYTQAALARLEEQLLLLESDSTSDTSYQIGRVVGILELAGQAQPLVSAVRQRFSRPNVIAYISEDFLDASLGRDVNDETPVSENILGTHQTGTARTTGRVHFRLEPDAERVHLVSELIGTTISENVGRRSVGRKSISIFSTGTTSVSAEKDLFVTLDGIQATPARVCCRTSTCIHCIQSPPLISGIVSSQVYSKKGQAEQIASQRAARRIGQRFDEQVRSAIKDNRGSGTGMVRSLLTRLDSRPESTKLFSSTDLLTFEVLQRNDLQLGAPTNAPVRKSDHDFGLSVHESAINNLFESVLAGKTFDRSRLLELASEQSSEASGTIQSELGEEDWSITFPSTQPIVVQFEEGGIRFRITGNRFTRDDQVIMDAMYIAGFYTPVETANGVIFQRQGDLEVDYVDAGPKSARQVAFRSFARDKFGLLFPEEVSGEGFQLPAQFGLADWIKLSKITSSTGWLELAWNRVPAAKETTARIPPELSIPTTR